MYAATGKLLIRKEPSGTTLYATGQEYKLTGPSSTTATRYYSRGAGAVAIRTSAGLAWLAAYRQAAPISPSMPLRASGMESQLDAAVMMGAGVSKCCSNEEGVIERIGSQLHSLFDDAALR